MGYRNSNQGAPVRRTNREAIAKINLTNSSSPTISTYRINPGLAESFPIGFAEARLYDQYRITALSLEWAAACGSGTPGTCVIAPEFNVNDPPPTTMEQIRNTSGSNEFSPWIPQRIPIQTKAMFPAAGQRKFIRDGLVPDNLQNYDACVINVATQDNGAATGAGVLWINYTVEYYVPQKSTTQSPTKASSFGLSGSQTLATGVEETVAFDVELANPLGITNTAGVFTLPKGSFLVTYKVSCFDTTAETFSADLDCQKNGADTSPMQNDGFTTSAVTNQRYPLSGSYIVTSDGTDTTDLGLTLTGAAGTLSVKQLYSSIIFQVI